MNGVHKKRVLNFSAGPGKLPEEVLLKIQSQLLHFDGIGFSILEMSHRSEEFSKILHATEGLMRDLMAVPENYKILFLQGGGTGQFSAIPLNLIARKPGKTADYVVTGSWSEKAAKEASKYGTIREVFPRMRTFTDIPDESTWSLNPDASYLYYCDNETIQGVSFPDSIVPSTPSNVPLVCDMSSSILSRPVDVSKFGLIFASAQKNIGCAGVTVVIVREDLLNYALPITPVIFDYKSQVVTNSLYNTPSTFGIYVVGEMVGWIKRKGGAKAMKEINAAKAQSVYDCIENSSGFYRCPVEHKYRSHMNIVFRIGDCDEALEKKFLEEASKRNMVSLKGHRLTGGQRISMYNAMSLREIEELVTFMEEFRRCSILIN